MTTAIFLGLVAKWEGSTSTLTWRGVMFLLLVVIAVLILTGLALWVIAQVPMDATIAKIIHVVIIASVVVWLVYIMFTVAGHVSPMVRWR